MNEDDIFALHFVLFTIFPGKMTVIDRKNIASVGCVMLYNMNDAKKSSAGLSIVNTLLHYWPEFHILCEVRNEKQEILQEFWIELAVDVLVKAEDFSQAASYMSGNSYVPSCQQHLIIMRYSCSHCQRIVFVELTQAPWPVRGPINPGLAMGLV